MPQINSEKKRPINPLLLRNYLSERNIKCRMACMDKEETRQPAAFQAESQRIKTEKSPFFKPAQRRNTRNTFLLFRSASRAKPFFQSI
ncbi:MAG: hypothetical protein V6Z82_02995 [Flavobacteriales bacterium]